MTTDEPFTNREIRQYFENFESSLNRMEENFNKRLGPVEENVSKLLLWKEGLMAKISVVVILMGMIWGAISDWFTKHVGVN